MLNQPWDALWINATLARCENGYDLMHDAAIACHAGKIVWIGPMSALPVALSAAALEIHDIKGACITPGLVDCHTHLVYAGHRAQEFEMRQHGETYASIAQAGGGIQSTVSQTRAASAQDLFNQSFKRAQAMCQQGVTTVEIKSGYGLNTETEMKMLQVANLLANALPLRVQKTFLGAHALPLEFKGNADGYIDYICEQTLPALVKENLVDAVDVFCESIAFNLSQTEKVFKAAKAHNLPIKCHAEQLSDLGASELAAHHGALSVEHLEFLSASSISALAKSGTVAVLLPGAFYFLKETTKPPVAALRKAGVKIAIATDCNPGSSPMTSLLLVMNMACVFFDLTPEEALLGVTLHAAKALGLDKSCGSLTVGKWADFVVWDIQHPAALSYEIGTNPLLQCIKAGKRVI